MKLVSTPTLDHQYQVVRADGLPDVPLTLFANDLWKSLSPASALRANLHAGSACRLRLGADR